MVQVMDPGVAEIRLMNMKFGYAYHFLFILLLTMTKKKSSAHVKIWILWHSLLRCFKIRECYFLHYLATLLPMIFIFLSKIDNACFHRCHATMQVIQLCHYYATMQSCYESSNTYLRCLHKMKTMQLCEQALMRIILIMISIQLLLLIFPTWQGEVHFLLEFSC